MSNQDVVMLKLIHIKNFAQ